MSNIESTENRPTQTCKCYSVVAYRVTAEDVPESDPETFAEFDVYESCGETTNKGKEFRPGHDAKLKSVLIKTFRSGEEFAFLDGGMLIHANPMEIAKGRGWAKFMTAAKPKKVRKAKATKVVLGTDDLADAIASSVEDNNVQGFHPCQVKIGRWWKDGTILSTMDDGQVAVAYVDGKGERHEVTVSADKVKEG